MHVSLTKGTWGMKDCGERCFLSWFCCILHEQTGCKMSCIIGAAAKLSGAVRDVKRKRSVCVQDCCLPRDRIASRRVTGMFDPFCRTSILSKR